MQFESREALINFEKEREEYYRNWFETSNKNLFEFYKLMFLETFHPKYRDIKKKYENYDGGWYRRGNNLIFATYLFSIDTKVLKEGEVCCELGSNYDENDIKSMYIYHKDMLIQM
jgi:hypothetical protein